MCGLVAVDAGMDDQAAQGHGVGGGVMVVDEDDAVSARGERVEIGGVGGGEAEDDDRGCVEGHGV